MLTVSLVSNYNTFRNYKDEWDDLLSKSDADNIFLTYDWIDACLKHFHKTEEVLILNIFQDNKLVGIAPLVIMKKRCMGFAARMVCFIGTSISDRMDFIIDGNKNKEEIITLILDYLMKIKGRWDIVDLQEIAENTGTMKIIERYIENNKIMNIIGPQAKSFFIELNKNKDFIFQKYSTRLRKRLRKNKLHDMNFKAERHMNGDINAESLFSTISDIERYSWKGEGQCGIFSKRKGRCFHEQIFNKFSNNKWLDVAILSINSKPAAYIYNYLYKQKSYNYNIAFDKKYYNFSPGVILMMWMLKDSASKDISEFDFIRGEGSWKKRFTETFRIHDRVKIFNEIFFSKHLYCFQAKIKPWLKKIKIVHIMWKILKDGINAFKDRR
nr:GNAT family N-acetyltransferase [Candidatus Omnitrophota bacterium]